MFVFVIRRPRGALGMTRRRVRRAADERRAFQFECTRISSSRPSSRAFSMRFRAVARFRARAASRSASLASSRRVASRSRFQTVAVASREFGFKIVHRTRARARRAATRDDARTSDAIRVARGRGRGRRRGVRRVGEVRGRRRARCASDDDDATRRARRERRARRASSAND